MVNLEWIISQVQYEHPRTLQWLVKPHESKGRDSQRWILPALANHLRTLISVLLIFFAFVSYFCFFLSQLFPAFLPSFFQLLIPQEFQMIDNGHFNNWIKETKIRGCSGEVGEEVKRQSLWPENEGNILPCTHPSCGRLTTTQRTKLPHTWNTVMHALSIKNFAFLCPAG